MGSRHTDGAVSVDAKRDVEKHFIGVVLCEGQGLSRDEGAVTEPSTVMCAQDILQHLNGYSTISDVLYTFTFDCQLNI